MIIDGPPRPTLAQLWSRFVIQVPVGILIAIYALRGLTLLGLPWFGVLLGSVLGVGLGVLARRSQTLRWMALGWMFLFGLGCAAWPVLYVVFLLR